jgi:outer membrane receptor protein involved in Fe transport
VVTLAFAPAPVRALDQPEDPNAEAPGGFVMQEGTPEVQVISREEIRGMAARSAADVIDRVAGFRTQQRVQGEAAAVSIEGMPPEYTRILVNGRRYNGRIGEVADLADISVHDVERIEILRGAQGLRFGAEAAGGVINIITRRAPEEEGARADADLGAGSDGAIQGAGALAVTLDRGDATLSLSRDQIDGFDPDPDSGAVFPAGGSSDSRTVRDDAYGTLRLGLTPTLQLRSSLGLLHEDESIVPDDESDDDEAERDFERWMGSTGLDWQIADATRLSGDVGLYRGLTDATVGREYDLAEDEWTLDLSLEHAVAALPFQNRLVGSLAARRQTLDLDEGEPPPDLELEDEIDDVDEAFDTLSLTLLDENHLARWATLTLGARLDMHSEFPSEWVPQAELLLTPHDVLRLRFSAAKNHRTPSLQDLYQPPIPQLGGSYFLAGSEDLEPESSTSLRAGFELSPHPAIGFSTTFFWNDIDDMIRSMFDGSIQTGTDTIVIVPDLPVCSIAPSLPQCQPQTIVVPHTAPLFRKMNLDTVRTRGLEAQFVVRPTPGSSLSAGWTLLDTQVDSAEFPDLHELPNSPRHTLDFQWRFALPPFDTGIGVAARWRGEALTETSGTGLYSFSSGEESRSTWIVDLRITQPITPRLELYADLENLGDQQVLDSYQIRGRTFFLGVRGNADWEGGVR